jgi:hypothetical protein
MAHSLIASSNRIVGNVRMELQPDLRSMNNKKEQEPLCTVVGNITGGNIMVRGGPLAPPWAPLNLQGVV